MSTTPAAKPWGDIACETFHYGAWNSGTRTIYATPTPLWEEMITSGSPFYGTCETSFTAFPKTHPETLPTGAIAMGFDDHGFGPFSYVDFGDNEDAAFSYAMTAR